MQDSYRLTKKAYIWSVVLSTPIWAMYSLLPYIVYKDLKASVLQITMMITLKPLVSLFSLYWSNRVQNRADRLKGNVIMANILGRVPFIFFPFIDEPWFFVLAYGIFMMMARGVIPAWMEILKLNLPDNEIKRVFARSQAFYYLIGGILPMGFGLIMDLFVEVEAWRYLFPLVAILSLFPIYFQMHMPLPDEMATGTKQPFFKALTTPWKDSWMLLKNRVDFSLFQIGFMLGGSGLMIMQPAFPAFFMGELHLSYTELGVALALCKGVGFAATSGFWSDWLGRVNIFRFSSLVMFLGALFPLLLLFAKVHLAWMYGAYLIFGVMQAGSELSWNLSGPIFAKEADSSPYSGVNVCTVGIRGCVAPPLGSLLCLYTSSSVILALGGLFCLAATFHMLYCQRVYETSSRWLFSRR